MGKIVGYQHHDDHQSVRHNQRLSGHRRDRQEKVQIVQENIQTSQNQGQDKRWLRDGSKARVHCFGRQEHHHTGRFSVLHAGSEIEGMEETG